MRVHCDAQISRVTASERSRTVSLVAERYRASVRSRKIRQLVRRGKFRSLKSPRNATEFRLRLLYLPTTLNITELVPVTDEYQYLATGVYLYRSKCTNSDGIDQFRHR